MKLIRAIIETRQLEAACAAIPSGGNLGITISPVQTFSARPHEGVFYRGIQKYLNFESAIALDVIVSDGDAEAVYQAMSSIAQKTGMSGMKIWLMEIVRSPEYRRDAEAA